MIDRRNSTAYCDGSNTSVQYVAGKLYRCTCGRELLARQLGGTAEGRLPWHRKHPVRVK